MNIAPGPNCPKISVIIAVRNEKAALRHTLASLREQSYPNLEVIVIDGASTDGSKEVIQNPPCKIDKWLSEPDEGIADAFNKGVQLATGEYLNFQGAGDSFTHVNALRDLFQDVPKGTAFVCGRIQRLTEDGQNKLWQAPKRWPKKFNKKSLLFKMALPHQGLFTHRNFFYRYGLFDKKCKFAMDYEILLRAYHHFPDVVCKNDLVANWRAGGVGTHRIHEIYNEYHAIKKQHQVAANWVLTGIDKWNRAKYSLKSILGLAS